MIYLQRLNTQGSANKLGNIFWEGLHDAAYMTGNALDKLSQHGPFIKQHEKCWKVLHCYCWCLHGDSQIVLSCLTSCLQFWLRFLATWNIPEGLEKYDKWYIILSHSRCSYHFWQLKHVDIDFWPTPIWEQPLRDGIDIWWCLQRAQWILASYASIQLIQEALVVYSIQACSDIFPSRSELQKSKLSMNRFAICFPDFTWSI